MRRHHARHGHGAQQLRASEARKQLALMLAGCTDTALAGFTVKQLVATHRVSRTYAEAALRYARERRIPDDLAVRPWNILGFCAGVGGLELGIHLAEPGARGIVYLEREASAAASLVASMEAGWLDPAPVWSDAGTFDARPWRGLVHCVASGDPCQPNSLVGKRKGADDDRWLIDQLLRVVAECRPDRVFRENVPGNIDGQLDALVPALERMDYRVACGIFSATEIGAPHRRERLYLMADAAGARCAGRDGAGVPRRDPAVRHAGPGAWWSTEPAVGRVADGLAGRAERLRAVGNGVVPLVAAHAWTALAAVLAAAARSDAAAVAAGADPTAIPRFLMEAAA